MNQSELKANTSCWHQVKKNVCKQVTISFGFTSDWRKPITKRGNANTKQLQNYFQHSTDAGNPMNQSELKANTSCWHQVKKNVCEQVTISFGVTSDW